VSGTIPLGEIAKSVTPRFNLVSLLPSSLLAAGVGILIASGAFSGVPSLHVLADRLRGVNVFVASLLFLVVLATALVLYPFQLLLVRILEGYWHQIPLLDRLQFIGMEINRRRWMILRGKDTDLLARLYPPSVEDLLPTRLGNVLRAAERRAGHDHGFTKPADMLPRIYPCISAPLAGAFGDARDDLDVACRMCVVLWLLALVSGGAFALDGAVPATRGLLLVVPAAAAFLGVVSYRAAIRAGESYGRFLFYVFDLHRRDLLRALGYDPPQSPDEERTLIEAITGWLVDGEPAPTSHRARPDQEPAAPPSV
jgi:hypothetical protein